MWNWEMAVILVGRERSSRDILFEAPVREEATVRRDEEERKNMSSLEMRLSSRAMPLDDRPPDVVGRTDAMMA